jgi:hypothetical protein
MSMDEARTLEPVEARILGVLIEKELTTPEQYPLSLNALTAGCNQKSNRDPVLDLSEAEVHAATGKLIVKGWLGSVHPASSRVERFRHNAATLLELSRPQVAVLAELLLRGAQQPGELRARASRMAELPTLEALRATLATLIEKRLVVRLDPQPGARAESYAQTLAPGAQPAPSRAAAPAPAAVAPAPAAPAAPAVDLAPVEQRLASLDLEVQKLKRQIANLAWKLGEKLDPS